MLKFVTVCTTGVLLGIAVAAAQPRAHESRFVFVNLRPNANHHLTDRIGRIQGSNLASLPTGEQTFAGVKFNVENDLLQLHSQRLPEPRAPKVDAIAVGRTAHKLHFLHGTAFGYSNFAISDDRQIAEYTVHYEGGSTAAIPVLYGRDVRDWMSPEECRFAQRGKLAWVGDNDESKSLERHLYLYLGTWENPKPEKRIATIDYAKVGDSPAAPFCVAITAEE
jgi:hypothetical protein